MKYSWLFTRISLAVWCVAIFSVAYAAITFDDDNSDEWYGPSDIRGFTDPTATVTYDGNFDAGECPKTSGSSAPSEVIIPDVIDNNNNNTQTPTRSSPPSQVSGHVSI